MTKQRRDKRFATWLGAGLAALALFASMPAQAVPSYARQTGMNCAACHVGGYGPQLTPAGIRFKLGGYTDTDGQEGKVPLSAMVVTSFTHTKKDVEEPAEHFSANDNLKMDEASVFLAGRLTDKLGAFVQVTHSGIEHKTSIDQLDLRLATTTELAGKQATVGITLNNNPGVQDPFNTLPVWGFPFISSEAGFGTGEASTVLDGGFEQRALGMSAYTLWNKSVYAELGTYRSLSPSFQSHLGLGHDDTQRLGSNAYWRLAYFQDLKSQSFSAGLVGFSGRVEPDRTVEQPRNKFNDLGVDASYQMLGTREHIVTINGSHIREHLTDGTTDERTTLKTTRVNASYYYDQTWGGSIGLFSTRGSDPADTTTGTMLQADWTPWGKDGASAPSPFSMANLRLGAQYWLYSKYGGDSTGASDKNTLYLFAWVSF
jgi:hypothetical protein